MMLQAGMHRAGGADQLLCGWATAVLVASRCAITGKSVLLRRMHLLQGCRAAGTGYFGSTGAMQLRAAYRHPGTCTAMAQQTCILLMRGPRQGSTKWCPKGQCLHRLPQHTPCTAHTVAHSQSSGHVLSPTHALEVAAVTT